MKSYEPLVPRVVLAVVAHPDDVDVIAAGSIAKYVAQGATAFYYVLTNGNKGSDDRSFTNDELRDIRREEQQHAAAAVGASDVIFGDYEDGALQASQAVKCDIARVIRQVKPDVLITFDPSVYYMLDSGMINHTDHRAVGEAAMDAAFPLARDWRSFPEQESEEKLASHKVATLLLINNEKANYFEDISQHMDAKIEALKSHPSQFGDIERVRGFVEASARKMGERSGFTYAEGFVRLDLPF